MSQYAAKLLSAVKLRNAAKLQNVKQLVLHQPATAAQHQLLHAQAAAAPHLQLQHLLLNQYQHLRLTERREDIRRC